MRQETFTLSQKELQRVSVITACVKGDMACASATGLLCLSERQIKRLKRRLREDGEAALAHANRGRPVPAACPSALARRSCACTAPSMPASTTITCAKSSTRSKASRLAAKPCAAPAPGRPRLPAQTRAPAHRQRACAWLAKANSCNSTAARTTGSQAASTPLGRAPGSLVQRTPPRRREHILRGRGFQQKAVGKFKRSFEKKPISGFYA